MATMKAAVIDPVLHRLTVEDRPVPEPGPDEALVRVRLAGICGTDFELVKGYMGFAGTPGHEFVGRVERCAFSPSWEGKRVVGDINAACGACPDCAQGRHRHCPSRTVLGILGRDGAYRLSRVYFELLREAPP